VILMLPFSWPISVVLDRVLGDEISGVYTRQGLFHLIKLNVEDPEHAKQSGLTTEDAKILGGALTFKDSTVGQVMTPLNRIFALPIDTVLDQDAFLRILEKGHTRVPVYEGSPSNIVDLLLVKNLLGIGFEHQLSLRSVLQQFRDAKSSKSHTDAERVRSVVRCPKHTQLNAAMDLCKKHHVHMLVVTEGMLLESAESETPSTREEGDRSSGVSPDLEPAVGIATIEDFIEEILQEEIVDETDVYVDNEGSQRMSKVSSLSHRTSTTRPSQARASDAFDTEGRQRLNSKHFDTTVLLRSEITRRSSARFDESSQSAPDKQANAETRPPPAAPAATGREQMLQRTDSALHSNRI